MDDDDDDDADDGREDEDGEKEDSDEMTALEATSDNGLNKAADARLSSDDCAGFAGKRADEAGSRSGGGGSDVVSDGLCRFDESIGEADPIERVESLGVRTIVAG